MQLLKKQLALLSFIALCANPLVFAETDGQAGHESHDIHNSQNSVDWPGVYHGFTPCSDCRGVKTSLALNSNGTYILMTQFIGKSEREFVEKGRFTWSEKVNTIDLTPHKNPTVRHYSVSENTLTQLDDNGNRYAGKNANAYVLRKIETKEPLASHSGH
jgi:copper homeostasis protein (lipoprotein)